MGKRKNLADTPGVPATAVTPPPPSTPASMALAAGTMAGGVLPPPSLHPSAPPLFSSSPADSIRGEEQASDEIRPDAGKLRRSPRFSNKNSHKVNGKEQELYAILFNGLNGSAQASITDGKSQWSPAKSCTTYSKDNKHSHPYDSVGTSSCFGSSVHYGGRDYYGSFTPKQSTEYNDYKAANKDPVTDSHGDWWQGSFNY